jgi:serine/threonine-protein kinase
MHVASRIFNEDPTPLGQLRPELPADLVTAVMRCLEKKPEARFPDVRGLAEALAPFAPEASISAERVARIALAGSTPVSGPSPLRGSQSGAMASVVATSPASTGRAWIVAGVAVAGVVVGFLLFSGRSRSAPAPVAAVAVATAPAPSSSVDVPTAATTGTARDPEPPEAGASPTPAAGAPSLRPAPVTPKKNPLSVGVK